ncbi:uncharacterized protein L969DRAFT_100826 [Mixia osmundae IAM 14324]|uniref:VHS domain-containing protein n=1 Tax=Mixia osmundae (strain CBS 9802 / IAM 14324 / JCM 22182 / KY 12970) TaxID=764103 RepID=G7EAI3_MIXOS|nr:uncharacterized protein L969DRAFT_100826 [Mixia osmundae IAM 14324]KEI42333.1 hypothetical protein L969DRAFT_100826 [Mixia osmundae IAM 14324]GAA99843.1 hypothetical protein E5Q_06546 [Mixia osmundae IAM 14324]
MAARKSSTRGQLEAYIERACDPYRPQPDMALNLEVADLINSKKANTPREAAMEVVKYVNDRRQHVAMLALHLLDTLVKNCGYPFHLQVATKDFLNELVRRFPERPPMYPPPPMSKILSLVNEWKNTICVHSRGKEDLVHVRDMWRLLSYKGYRFPDFDKRAAQVLNPIHSLKSPEELEEEDRAAQAAKLQELIRRGSPKDLAAAQELMKIMSGAEPDKRPDYAEQSQKELNAIQSRVLTLNEMLNNAQPGERFVEGDAYDQIATRCRNVQPKIQKWITEAAESNPDQMDKLLMMNDLLNNVLTRYEAFKKGDRTATAEIDPAFASAAAQTQARKSLSNGRPAANGKAKAAPLNLIDFDDFVSAEPEDAASGLAGLSLTGDPAPAPTDASGLPLDLFSSNGTASSATPYARAQQQQQQQKSNADIMSFFASSQPNASAAWGSTVSAPVSVNTGTDTPTGGQYAFGSIQLGAPSTSRQASGSTPNYTSPVPAAAQPQPKHDPFGDLLS